MASGQTRAAPARAPEPLAWVQDFLNSVHVERGIDELANAESATRLVTSGQMAAETAPHPPQQRDGWLIGDADLDRLVRVRSALRTLIRAGVAEAERAEAVRVLSQQARHAPVALGVDPQGWLRLDADGTGCDQFVSRLLTTVLRAQQDGTWHRLKICRADSCAWVFYDTSRNRSATWCAMGVCGNRQKVSRHRQRRRQPHADG